MFIIQLLKSMKISVKYLVIMYRVDNAGAIFMASNITTTSHAKHIDFSYNYVNKYVEDRIIKIIFVKYVNNDSNILTNNLSEELHEKHSKEMMMEKMFLASNLTLKGC